MLALGEEVPPEWPDDAALTTEDGDLGSTSIRVRWTEATDNVGVSRYVVYLDGEPAGTTTAGTRVLRLNGLQPDTEYDVAVQAVDSRGSESTDGPTLTVRTLPSDSVELRPLEGTVAAGGTAALSWEAPVGADEVLLRRYVGDTLVDEQSLATDADDVEQTGLAADTTYGFQVFVRTGDQVRAFTERIELRTRALSFDTLTWEPTMIGDVAQRGLVVPITATAERGRDVTVAVDYQSWYDDAHALLDAPATRTALVTLTEEPTQPGTYRGGFELVDGIAQVTRMRGTVTDGAGHVLDRTSPRSAVGVSSELSVEIDAPAGAFTGGWVQATGEQWYGQPIGTDSVVPFPNARAGTYQVKVYDDLGDLMGSWDDVRVRPGLLTQVSVQPQLPASLELVVRDEANVPVDNGYAELRDHETGEWLGLAYLGSDGRAVVSRLRAGQVLDVDLDFPDHALLRDHQQRVTIAPGLNRVEVTAQGVARATLRGVVSYEDGEPVEGALVRVVQTHGGTSHTFTDQTDESGGYNLRALAGPGQVSVTAGALSHREEVDLTGGGSTTRDVTLHGPRMYSLRLRLFTRSPGAGAEVGPVPLDWRTAVHYGMSLKVEGQHQWYTASTVADDGSTLTTVNGALGQRLEWCIDGREPRLVPTCDHDHARQRPLGHPGDARRTGHGAPGPGPGRWHRRVTTSAATSTASTATVGRSSPAATTTDRSVRWRRRATTSWCSPPMPSPGGRRSPSSPTRSRSISATSSSVARPPSPGPATRCRRHAAKPCRAARSSCGRRGATTRHLPRPAPSPGSRSRPVRRCWTTACCSTASP